MGATESSEPGSIVSEHSDYFFGLWIVYDDAAQTTLKFVGPKNRMCLLASTFSMRSGECGKMYGASHLGNFVASYNIEESEVTAGYYSLHMHIKRAARWQKGEAASFVSWVTAQPHKAYDLVRGEDGNIVLRDCDTQYEWRVERAATGLGLDLGEKGRAKVAREDASAPGSIMVATGADGERVEFVVPSGEDDIRVRYIPRHSLYRKPSCYRTKEENKAWDTITTSLGIASRHWFAASETARQSALHGYREACEGRRTNRRRRRTDVVEVDCMGQY